jgi:hypothetical protein
VTGQREIPDELSDLDENFLAQQSDMTLRMLAQMRVSNAMSATLPASSSEQTESTS